MMATTDGIDSFGTDLRVSIDIQPVNGTAEDFVNLALRIARRLDTPLGQLIDDPTYGYDLKAALNSKLTRAGMSVIQNEINAQVELDSAVHSCQSALTPGSLDVELALDTVAGPFPLVLRASDVTVAILSLGGATVDVEEITAVTLRGLKGDPGPAGIQGPAGPSSPASENTIDLDFGSEVLAVSSGDEEWLGERLVDFDDLPASLTVKFAAEVLSLDGTGTFRVRIGGTAGAVDGTVVATITTTSVTFEAKQSSGSIASLTGEQLVKVTAENATVDNDAQITAVLVTIR
jgi:hypothetical protein